MTTNTKTTLHMILGVCVLSLALQNASSASGDKSKKMCEKYGKAVYTKEVSPVLTSRSLTSSVSQCAISEIPLIVGGKTAGLKEFPHQAALGYGKTRVIHWLCGGSLISENFVLTAAHCASSPENGKVRWVKLGDLHLTEKDPPDTTQTILVSKIIKHPKFKESGRYHDIALVKLVHPAKFTGHVRPACLHTDPVVKWTSGIASGYGRQSFNSQDENKKLMKVQLDLIDSVKCNKSYEAEVMVGAMAQGIIPSQLCAGILKGGHDTCQGDSGGPMQQVLTHPYCMYSIFGVTSFGKFCAFKNSPAVYTRVASYKDWIEKIVWP